MESVEDIKVIKEKIMKTDQVLKLYRNNKKRSDEITKKCKELMKELSILKLDNDMKSFQYTEQCKEIELLKETNSKLTTENDSIKSTYDAHINDLQIKYQNVCRDMNKQISEEKPQAHEKKKRGRKKSKLAKIHDDSSANEYFSEDVDQNDKILKVPTNNTMHTIKIDILSDSSNVNQQSLNDFEISLNKGDSEESFKLNENLVMQLRKFEEERSTEKKNFEEREMHLRAEWQENESKLKRTIEDLKEKFQKDRINLVKSFEMKEVEMKNKFEKQELKLKSKISELNNKILVEKSTITRRFEEKIISLKNEWQDKEQILKAEIHNLKQKIHDKITFIKNLESKETSMIEEWQEKENMLKTKISSLGEEINYLSKNKNIESELSRNSSHVNNAEKQILTKPFKEFQQETKEMPLSDENDVDTIDISYIFEEMRMPLPFLSPIPESPFQEDHIIPEDIVELPSPEQKAIVSNNVDIQPQQDLSERYMNYRKRKEMNHRRLCTIKKAKQKFWLDLSGSFSFKRNSSGSNKKKSSVKSSNGSESTPETIAGNPNTIVNGIASAFADIVSQKWQHSKLRTRVASEKNVLEVNKMLLEKAKYENLLKDLEVSSDDDTQFKGNECTESKETYRIDSAHGSDGILYEKHSSGLDTPNFVDSCYESIPSNPPSIQSPSKESLIEEKGENNELESCHSLSSLNEGELISLKKTEAQMNENIPHISKMFEHIHPQEMNEKNLTEFRNGNGHSLNPQQECSETECKEVIYSANVENANIATDSQMVLNYDEQKERKNIRSNKFSPVPLNDNFEGQLFNSQEDEKIVKLDSNEMNFDNHKNNICKSTAMEHNPSFNQNISPPQILLSNLQVSAKHVKSIFDDSSECNDAHQQNEQIIMDLEESELEFPTKNSTKFEDLEGCHDGKRNEKTEYLVNKEYNSLKKEDDKKELVGRNEICVEVKSSMPVNQHQAIQPEIPKANLAIPSIEHISNDDHTSFELKDDIDNSEEYISDVDEEVNSSESISSRSRSSSESNVSIDDLFAPIILEEDMTEICDEIMNGNLDLVNENNGSECVDNCQEVPFMKTSESVTEETGTNDSTRVVENRIVNDYLDNNLNNKNSLIPIEEKWKSDNNEIKMSESYVQKNTCTDSKSSRKCIEDDFNKIPDHTEKSLCVEKTFLGCSNNELATVMSKSEYGNISIESGNMDHKVRCLHDDDRNDQVVNQKTNTFPEKKTDTEDETTPQKKLDLEIQNIKSAPCSSSNTNEQNIQLQCADTPKSNQNKEQHSCTTENSGEIIFHEKKTDTKAETTPQKNLDLEIQNIKSATCSSSNTNEQNIHLQCATEDYAKTVINNENKKKIKTLTRKINNNKLIEANGENEIQSNPLRRSSRIRKSTDIASKYYLEINSKTKAEMELDKKNGIEHFSNDHNYNTMNKQHSIVDVKKEISSEILHGAINKDNKIEENVPDHKNEINKNSVIAGRCYKRKRSEIETEQCDNDSKESFNAINSHDSNILMNTTTSKNIEIQTFSDHIIEEKFEPELNSTKSEVVLEAETISKKGRKVPRTEVEMGTDNFDAMYSTIKNQECQINVDKANKISSGIEENCSIVRENLCDSKINSTESEEDSLKIECPTKTLKRKRTIKGSLMAKSIKIYKFKNSVIHGGQHKENVTVSSETETNNSMESRSECKNSIVSPDGAPKAKRRKISLILKKNQISLGNSKKTISTTSSKNAIDEQFPSRIKMSVSGEPSMNKNNMKISKMNESIPDESNPTNTNDQTVKNFKNPELSSNLTINMDIKPDSKLAVSKLDKSKINIFQDIILRNSKTLGNNIQKRGGFKRPLSSKILPACPESPPLPEVQNVEPIIIPLDKPSKLEETKASSLFKKLLTYSTEEKTVEEVAKHFINQEPEYISRLILKEIIQDKEKPDAKVSHAPLMTHTQRIMFGLMLKLEKMKVSDLIKTYLKISELYLLTTNELAKIEPLTRLNVAICKSHCYIERMRRFCLEAFYFMGDLAIPLLFTVLTSWIEVLPLSQDSESFPMVKVLIQLVHLKTCNIPGYNLLPLRELLHKYYQYPNEPWNSDKFFRELFTNYLKNPVTPGDFPVLLYCKNNNCKWVCQKIDTLIKPLLSNIKNDNFKATLFVLIGNILSQFREKSNLEYTESTKDWLKALTKEENISEIVKRSLLYAINKLPKSPKKKKNSEEK